MTALPRTAVAAPWTAEQVTNLNDYQASGYFHPFTHGDGDAQVDLIATTEGWRREVGGPVVQTWAHGFMLDGSWREMLSSWNAHRRTP